MAELQPYFDQLHTELEGLIEARAALEEMERIFTAHLGELLEQMPPDHPEREFVTQLYARAGALQLLTDDAGIES